MKTRVIFRPFCAAVGIAGLAGLVDRQCDRASRVSEQFRASDIQAAIDAAPGDTILVEPGTYIRTPENAQQ